jgi:hypothetical protein
MMSNNQNLEERHDPIVEEARSAGQAYIDSFQGDCNAMLTDLRKRAIANGRKPVSFPPRIPKPIPALAE